MAFCFFSCFVQLLFLVRVCVYHDSSDVFSNVTAASPNRSYIFLAPEPAEGEHSALAV